MGFNHILSLTAGPFLRGFACVLILHPHPQQDRVLRGSEWGMFVYCSRVLAGNCVAAPRRCATTLTTGSALTLLPRPAYMYQRRRHPARLVPAGCFPPALCLVWEVLCIAEAASLRVALLLAQFDRYPASDHHCCRTLGLLCRLAQYSLVDARLCSGGGACAPVSHRSSHRCLTAL